MARQRTSGALGCCAMSCCMASLLLKKRASPPRVHAFAKLTSISLSIERYECLGLKGKVRDVLSNSQFSVDFACVQRNGNQPCTTEGGAGVGRSQAPHLPAINQGPQQAHLLKGCCSAPMDYEALRISLGNIMTYHKAWTSCMTSTRAAVGCQTPRELPD
jgi:hypothetical protein